MLNKDILGLIRGDVKRNKKPKKQLEDFLIGEDEIAEEEFHSKRKKENQSEAKIVDDLDAPIGESYGESKKSKPKLEMMNFGDLNKKMAKDQIRDLKREYITLYETLEDVTEDFNKEQSEKYEIQIKFEYLRKEMRELKRVFREILNYFPDAFALKETIDSTDWQVQQIEEEFFEKLGNLKSNVKLNNEKLEEEQLKADEQKRLMIEEIENTRQLVINAEKEKFDLRNELAKAQHLIQELEEKIKNAPVVVQEVVKEIVKEEVTPIQAEIPQYEKEEKTSSIQSDEETEVETEIETEIPEVEIPEIDVPEIDVPVINVAKEVETKAEKPSKVVEKETKIPKEAPQKAKEEAVSKETTMKFSKPVDEKPKFEAPKFEAPKFKDLSTFDNVKIEKEENPNYLFISVDKHMEGLSNSSKYIIKVIGETGLERNAELIKYIESDEGNNDALYQNGKFNKNEFNNVIKNLRDRQFLESSNVKLGSKGGYDFIVYKLTDIGKAVFYKLYNQNPVKSLMDLIIEPHASLEHGYLIKEIATEFKAMGYKVYEDREDCTYDVGGGNRKVFDLIVEDKTGYKMHIEVERGTHNNQDFSNMMDKIFAVTQDVYFVAPNEHILYKEVKGKVFSWITNKLGGFENAKGKIKFSFTTFEKIKKHQTTIWEKYEP